MAANTRSDCPPGVRWLCAVWDIDLRPMSNNRPVTETVETDIYTDTVDTKQEGFRRRRAEWPY